MNRDILELVFKHSGGVELRAVTAADTPELDTVVWASDDPNFMDAFPRELFSANDEDEVEKILAWLVDNDVIDDEEADDARIVEESLDGRDIADPDDDDDGDEDDDEGLSHAHAV